MKMTNLFDETQKALGNHGLTWSDVIFVCDEDGYIPLDVFINMAKVINYDNGYGNFNIELSLKIVGVSWWLNREEYGGHEGWAFYQKPSKPEVLNMSPNLAAKISDEKYTIEKRIEH